MVVSNVDPILPCNIEGIPLGLADMKSGEYEGYKFTYDNCMVQIKL